MFIVLRGTTFICTLSNTQLLATFGTISLYQHYIFLANWSLRYASKISLQLGRCKLKFSPTRCRVKRWSHKDPTIFYFLMHQKTSSSVLSEYKNTRYFIPIKHMLRLFWTAWKIFHKKRVSWESKQRFKLWGENISRQEKQATPHQYSLYKEY